jgi:hypothetical protein
MRKKKVRSMRGTGGQKMKSSDILLSLEWADLVVWKVKDGVCVKYDEAWVSGCGVLEGAFGKGVDFEDACENYLQKIRGKQLVFEGIKHKARREVRVLG